MKTLAIQDLTSRLFAKVITLILILLFTSQLFAQDTRAKYALQELTDIPYYTDPAMINDLTRLNLIIPMDLESPPVLIWIGGGAWAYVDRNREMELCRQMARQGIAVVSVGHRLSPALIMEPKNPDGIQHPEHIVDVAHAFKWVYDQAEKYGYSTENIFVGGFSSGAHLSTLLAMDNRYLKSVGLSRKVIKGVIPVGGGFDIPHYREKLIEEDPAYDKNHIRAVFGDTHAQHVEASPVTYIDSLITPILMVSEKSTYVYSIVFEELLREKAFEDFVVLNVHNETHGSLWQKLSYEENNIYRNFIVDYIRSRCNGDISPRNK